MKYDRYCSRRCNSCVNRISDCRQLHFNRVLCGLGLGHSLVAAVQYTFTHKQYTEQQNETDYREQKLYNNKNT